MPYYSVVALAVAVSLLLLAVAMRVFFSRSVSPPTGDVRLSALASSAVKRRCVLSLNESLKNARKCAAYLSSRPFLSPFERVLYDNYYEMLLNCSAVGVLLPPLPMYEGAPRLRRIADAVLTKNDGKLDRDLLYAKISAFNAYGALTYDEITSLYVVCRAAIVDYLGEKYARCAEYSKLRLKGENDGAKGRIDFSLIRTPGYIAGLKESLSESEYEKFRQACFDNGVDEESVREEEKKVESSYELCVTNAFRSLKNLSAAIGDEFLLSVSKVNAFYLRSGVFYDECDEATKLEYLRLTARSAGRGTELAAAARSVHKARSSGADLYAVLRGKFASGALYAVYFALLCVFSAAVSAFFAVKIHFAAFFAFVPLIAGAYMLSGRLYKGKRFTPRVKEAKGKAVIVIPTLVFDVDEAKESVDRARKVSYANPGFDVCLLCDVSGDKRPAVMDYFSGQSGVIILVRKEGGWEKKRGALIDFNALLLGSYDAFDLKSGYLKEYDYAITLDSDTELTYAERAVRAIEHPFFKDRAVLAFNGVSSFFSARNAYSRLFSFPPSRYFTAVDAEYDLFGYGNFTGKGVYRVREFYDKTAFAFEDETVLSHDYIEGAFAGAAATDIDAPESIPESFGQSLSRSTRWVRGDWQLLRFLAPRIRDRRGEKRSNPISAVNRIHILKSCLFSLSPVCQIVLLIFASIEPVLLVFAFLPTIIDVFFALFSPPRVIFKSLAARVYEFCVLPAVACYNLFAIVLTVIRLIRRKNLLVWQTFAHSRGKQTDKAPAFVFFAAFTFAAFYFGAWYSLVFAFAFLAGAFGFLLETEPVKRRDAEVSKVFLEYSNAIGAYFRTSLYGSARFLIPDNVSCENGKTSPQTSPTDIGFSLVSLLQLRRLGLMKDDEFFSLTDKVISSVFSLEKYRGHLFNWYSTDGKPLNPKYVSSVDSGNFFACLAAITPHLSPDSRQKAQKMLDSVDFTFLVDPKSKLLSTGLSVERKALDPSRYDLYSSESLLTYVFCVGYGYIGHECALRLNRKSVYYRGNATYSWTGGGFEYLMPALFLPVQKGTTYYRSCVTACKAQSAKKGFWGISESQYDDYDDLGNRKYKAFGISALALSETEKAVYSTYACALCAPFIPKKVVASLSAACEKGMKGPLGLFEAYDEKPIRTYMAHHQGMTLCAFSLALGLPPLLDGDPKIRAGLEYFTFAEEKARAKSKPRFERLPRISPSVSDDPSPANYFTDGAYLLRIGASGETRAYYDGISVYNKCETWFNIGGETYSPFGAGDAEHVKGKTVYRTVRTVFTAEQEVAVIPSVGEIRKTTLRNVSAAPLKGWIGSYYRPVLNDERAFNAHPTYSDLFVKSEAGYGFAECSARGLTVVLHSTAFSSTETDRCAVYRGAKSASGVFPALLGNVKIDLLPGKSMTYYTVLSCSREETKARAFCRIFDQKGGEAIFDEAYYRGKYSSVSPKIKALAEGVFHALAPLSSGFTRPVILLKVRGDGVTRGISEVFGDLAAISPFVKFDVCVAYERRSGYFDGVKSRISDVFALRFAAKDVKCFFFDELTQKAEIEALEKYAAKQFVLPAYVKRKVARAALPAPDLETKKSILTVDGGYFTDGGFVVTSPAPRAWYNVAADGEKGFIVSESGGGFIFFGSSYSGKVTPYRFGVIDDRADFGIVIEENGGVFSVPALPCGGEGKRNCLHGFGYTEYSYARAEAIFRQRISLFGGGIAVTLEIDNLFDEERVFSLAFFARLVLGVNEEDTRAHIRTYKNEDGVEAVNALSGNKCRISTDGVTALSFSLSSITDRDGVFVTAKPLRIAEEGKDAVIFGSVGVKPRARAIKTWIITEGAKICADTENERRRIADYFSSLSPVRTKEKYPFSVLLPYLAYQTLSCRFFARSGPYQVGGAYGFRDQLQDCLALLYFDPRLVREHILKCASKQFESGDVLHWWHPASRGVRSGYADDRLFLGFVTAKYISFTRDDGILNEKVAFLIGNNSANKYADYESTDYSVTLLEHVQRAIRSIRFAKNGLALMEGGDWNDAMDKAGDEGKGSSVWLSIFLYAVIGECLPFLPYADFYRRVATNLRRAVNSFYNGRYFARLVTDEGRALGYDDGFIDLITQAWASASGITDAEKASSALSACDALFDREHGVVKLLWPPFKKNDDVGSIGDYPPGVRENGGQYTHGALWYAIALFKAGKNDEAYEVFSALLPTSHSTGEKAKVYGAEPYVICADVYSCKGSGEAGWSWYTGSAAWAYVLIVEWLLGIKISGDKITVTPRLPSSVPTFTFDYVRGETTLKFRINNAGSGIWRARQNGVGLNGTVFSLDKSAEYEIYKE